MNEEFKALATIDQYTYLNLRLQLRRKKNLLLRRVTLITFTKRYFTMRPRKAKPESGRNPNDELKEAVECDAQGCDHVQLVGGVRNKKQARRALDENHNWDLGKDVYGEQEIICPFCK